jgi:hypothetical protein
LPDDKKILRKSGLLFTRDFVGTGAGDEAVGWHNQFAMMCNGDGLDTALMHGLYGLLVKMAASHSYYRRGYLLGPDGGALTAGELGAMLNIGGRRMLVLLNRFKRVKLLEYVTLPDFDELENQAKNTAGAGDERPKSTGKKRKKSTGKGAKNQQFRNSPEISGNFRNALNKTTNGCAGKATNDNNGSSSLKQTTAHVEQDSAQKEPTARGEPFKPQEAATSGEHVRGHIIPLHAPGSSGSAEYSRQDYIFGQRIYQALGFSMAIEDLEAVREITSFASKWRQAQRRLGSFSPEMIDQVAMRLIQEARKIGRRPQNRNRGAVFNGVVDVIVNSRLKKGTA